jgi:riboflavin synthase alpha subunit
MESTETLYLAPVEGLGKKGEIFSFIIGLPSACKEKINTEDRILINGVEVQIKEVDDEYIYFDLSFQHVSESSLAELVVGDEVVISVNSTAVR